MKLVIVESPTKARTIKGFLGRGYNVLSSYGHVRDLPKSKLGVDVDKDFQEEYVTPVKARKALTALKKAVKNADGVILATDEDREGEAISWHLVKALGLNASKTKNAKLKAATVERIVFHEITKEAVEEALKNPRAIDANLVDAQRARRILDRLVGYKLSPLLWKKIARGLSAGRVQSVALKLIVDREKERDAFKIEEYWSLDLTFEGAAKAPFVAKLTKLNGQALEKMTLQNEGSASEALVKVKAAQGWHVAALEQKEGLRHPSPPFMTATLQQDAARRLGWSGKMTMSIAQQLYEGFEIDGHGHTGLITYMRTDSLNLGEKALDQAAGFIKNKFGAGYVQTRRYKTKAKSAQEAHEAIRPTNFNLTADKLKGVLDSRQMKLYTLIWQRALASQMAPAKVLGTSINIADKSLALEAQAKGQVITFDGFLAVYAAAIKDELLPSVKEGEDLKLNKAETLQHFTKPPARYSEAMLIKALKDHSIGRPSTYAPTVDTILRRLYIERDADKRFTPTDLGKAVNELLAEHFPDIVDIDFTANMENDLDAIAAGEKPWVPVIRTFYEPFIKRVAQKEKTIVKSDFASQPTDKVCPKCGKPIVKKFGRFGQFYACSGFPECKHAEAIVESTGVKCPTCAKESRTAENQGEMIARRTRKGKIFYGCNKYPACKFALWDKPTGETCNACGALMVAKGKSGVKCSSKECDTNKR